MSFALGIEGEKRNVNTEKQSEVSMKEVTVYSGEKVVFSCIGRANTYSDGKMVAPMLPEYPNLTKCGGCGTIKSFKYTRNF